MAVSATPAIPVSTATTQTSSVKIATPDLIEFDTTNVSVEYMTDLVFEDIGGKEVISVSRNDLVNGQKVLYNPIKNTAQLSSQYGPQTLLTIPDSAASYFKNYAIDFEEKVPEIGGNVAASEVTDVVYIEQDTGNLVINLINLKPDEQVDIQVISSGEQLGAIIY